MEVVAKCPCVRAITSFFYSFRKGLSGTYSHGLKLNMIEMVPPYGNRRYNKITKTLFLQICAEDGWCHRPLSKYRSVKIPNMVEMVPPWGGRRYNKITKTLFLRICAEDG